MGKKESNALKIIQAIRNDPVYFSDNVLGIDLWEKQREIIRSVFKNKRTAVASCHGAGKSCTAATVGLAWLSAYPDSIVITTAPTGRQVKEILWSRIRGLYNNSIQPIGGYLYPQACILRVDDEWMMYGFSTDSGENFQGPHSEHVLVIIDEASGVDKSIWVAIEGILSSGKAHLLVIGNPTDPTSEFANECKSPGTNVSFISAFDTPNFTKFGIEEKHIADGSWKKMVDGKLPRPYLINPAWVADKYTRKGWGPTSPLYISRVKGIFPDTDVNSLFPWGLLLAAQDRTLVASGASEMAIDLARYGDDETIFMKRNGPVARTCGVFTKKGTDEVKAHAKKAIKKHNIATTKVDGVGMGGPLVDFLRKDRVNTIEMIAGATADDDVTFGNAKTEWFFNLVELFKSGEIDIDPEDDELIAQLLGIRYTFDRKDRQIIVKKDIIKKTIGCSPDRADALAMVFGDFEDKTEYYRSLSKW